MQSGGQIQLTDGKGSIYVAEVINNDKKKCDVKIVSKRGEKQRSVKVTIAISLLKNSSRFEWFLEKATEIGVSNIIPLLCQRTEKQHFRSERMHNILISALLQSRQTWLPQLSEPIKFTNVISKPFNGQKFIAHCIDVGKSQLRSETFSNDEQLILIGPEGDFTQNEVDIALKNNFTPVSLGSTRLRTETAGIVACVFLNN